MELESVKIKKNYVEHLRKRKKKTGVPIGTSIEFAIASVYGEPEVETKKKQSKK
jgi:hypothetical protein